LRLVRADAFLVAFARVTLRAAFELFRAAM